MTKLSTKNMSLLFHIEGKSLNPNKVNPLLDQWYEKLMDIKIENEQLKLWPARVTNLLVEEIDTSLLIASYEITWEVREYVENANAVESMIVQALTNLRISNDLKYGKRIEIRAKEYRFQGEVAHGRWPKESNTVVSY